MKVSRGGTTVKTGKIGRVNCLRQQLLMPGEMINARMAGKIRLESLRERDVLRINAHLATFLTPVRWLQANWPTYVKEGPETAQTLDTTGTQANWDSLGVGSYQASALGAHLDMFEDSLLRIFNEWYKWPEDADITSWPALGGKAVPLSKPWSRCRYDATPADTENYAIDVSGATMDVRALATMQARFRDAMKREVFSFGRWMETVKEIWGGDPSREVDQVPIMIDQVDVGVNPREIPATDGASLGTWQSLFDFGVDHQVRGIVAPEHCILSYMLTVRFAPIIEGAMPLATDALNWFEYTGNPEWIANQQPTEVTRDMIQQTSSTTSLGYLPAGWMWRCEHDVIGEAVDIRDSFPYMLNPTTQAECKDATRVKDAFRSQALNDYLVDIYFKEDSRQPIGSAMDSYFSGMLEDTTPRHPQSGSEFPKGGKSL